MVRKPQKIPGSPKKGGLIVTGGLSFHPGLVLVGIVGGDGDFLSLCGEARKI